MNYSLLIILCLAVGLIAGFLKFVVKPIIKGKIGEFYVSSMLSGLPENKYILLNDIILPSKNGTTQIDHILLSIYGIFVIETKNYKGWIYGSDYSDKWTQNIYGNKNYFKNPLKQNYGHICTLKDLLEIDEDKFISIIAFSGESTLKVKTTKEVTYIGRVRKIVLKYQTPILTEEDIVGMKSTILSASIESTHSNRVEHVKNIKSNIQKDRQMTEMRICPKCGGKLVDRNGKHGSFVGCSNFPKCRYTSGT